MARARHGLVRDRLHLHRHDHGRASTSRSATRARRTLPPIDVLAGWSPALTNPATGARSARRASSQQVTPARAARPAKTARPASVRRARGHPEGGAARTCRSSASAARARRRAPPSRIADVEARRRRRRRRSRSAGAVRAGAVLRHERRREAVAAVVRATTTRASRSAATRRTPTSCAARRHLRGDLSAASTRPSESSFALAARSSAACWRGAARSAQSPLSQSQRAPSGRSPSASARGDRAASRWSSTDDCTLHATHLVFDSATAADQALRGLVDAATRARRRLQVVPPTVRWRGGVNGMTIARYTFLPWLRRGIANHIQTPARRGREPRDAAR